MPAGGNNLKKVFVIESFIQEINLETLIQPITKKNYKWDTDYFIQIFFFK